MHIVFPVPRPAHFYSKRIEILCLACIPFSLNFFFSETHSSVNTTGHDRARRSLGTGWWTTIPALFRRGQDVWPPISDQVNGFSFRSTTAEAPPKGHHHQIEAIFVADETRDGARFDLLIFVRIDFDQTWVGFREFEELGRVEVLLDRWTELAFSLDTSIDRSLIENYYYFNKVSDCRSTFYETLFHPSSDITVWLQLELIFTSQYIKWELISPWSGWSTVDAKEQ